MPARDADEYDSTSGGSRVGHNAKLKLPTVVSDEPLRHEDAEWLKAAETQLIASQMLVIASGGEPMSCQLIEDYDLVDYPELPEDHRDFYKRNTLRMELSRKNRLNEKKRTLLTLDAWDSLYAACRAATIKTAPMTFEALEAECDLSMRFAPPHLAARQAFRRPPGVSPARIHQHEGGADQGGQGFLPRGGSCAACS